jgi:hypothetical protein
MARRLPFCCLGEQAPKMGEADRTADQVRSVAGQMAYASQESNPLVAACRVEPWTAAAGC